MIELILTVLLALLIMALYVVLESTVRFDIYEMTACFVIAFCILTFILKELCNPEPLSRLVVICYVKIAAYMVQVGVHFGF